MENTLSRAATWLRDSILLDGDMRWAMRVSNPMMDATLDAFNTAGTNTATSLLARAMLIRGHLEVAAHWLADMTGAPLPECFAAIRSLVDDPPPGMEGYCWDERKEGDPRG